MKTVTPEFLAEQAKHKLKYYRHVTLYRRYWDSTAGKYKLAEGLNIDDYITNFGKISQAQDIDLGEWKTSNLNIEVKNIDREWNRYTNDGIWQNYIPEFSEFVVNFGYVDDEGAEHGVDIFRGVITYDGIRENLQTRRATIHIRGLNEILSGKSAEDLIDNQVTGENIGTGNASEVNFYTSNNGVGIVRAVYLDGTEQDLGIDYDVADLNKKSIPAHITFSTPPGSGVAVTIDYVYWYQDKSFKYLIEKMLDHCEIDNYAVQEVTYPNSIESTVQFDTKAEFDAGDKEGVETLSGQDRLYMCIEHNNVPKPAGGEYEVTYISKDSGIINIGGYPKLESGVAQSFTVKKTQTIDKVGFYIVDWDDSYGDRRITGVKVVISTSLTGSVISSGTLNKADFNVGWNSLSMSTATLTAGTTYYMRFELEVDLWEDICSASLQLATDGTGFYDNGNAYEYKLQDGWGGAEGYDILFYVIQSFPHYAWMSTTIDCSTAIRDYGNLRIGRISTGAYTLYTRSQDTDSGWPSTFDTNDWDEAPAGVITSTPRRYLRVAYKVEYTPLATDYDPYDEPYLTSIKVNYFTSKYSISLANFTGESCLSVIQNFALMSDYEFGFLPDRSFFFRAKRQETSEDLLIYGVTKLLDFGVDWNRVKNKIVSSFGQYSREISPDTEGDSSPTSFDKYGVRELNVFGGNILTDENIDLARGIGLVYYNKYKEIKTKTRIKCKLFPQLDAGDLVRLSYEQTQGLIVWDLLDWDGLYWSEGYTPYGMLLRVVKLIIDTEAKRDGGMELQLLEVQE